MKRKIGTHAPGSGSLNVITVGARAASTAVMVMMIAETDQTKFDVVRI